MLRPLLVALTVCVPVPSGMAFEHDVGAQGRSADELRIVQLARSETPLFTYRSTNPVSVPVKKPSKGSFFTEVVPWFLDAPQLSGRVFLATTNFTALVRTDATLIDNNPAAASIRAVGARKILSPEDGTLWARNYNGAFGATTLDKGTAEQTLLFTVHGENKNERIAKRRAKQNTVAPSVTTAMGASGYDAAGTYRDYYSAYFSFVSLRSMPSNAGNGYVNGPITDLGPVAWPGDGYLNAQGTQASQGVKHPTPFVGRDGYHYIYYVDASPLADGIKVVRAPAAQAADPSAYRVYYKINDNPADPANWAKPSLPDGFTKATAAAFLSRRGNPSTAVASRGTYAGRLAVALVRGSNPPEYRGVEEYSGDGKLWVVRLMKSTDLVTWTPIGVLQQGDPRAANFMNYPILVSQYGEEAPGIIDGDNFGVLGTAFDGKNTVGRMDVRNGSFVAP